MAGNACRDRGAAPDWRLRAAESQRRPPTFTQCHLKGSDVLFCIGRGAALLELLGVKACVIAIERQQLGMTPALDNTPLIHDENQIGLLDRRQTVGDHQRRTPLHHLIQGSLDMPLGLRVQRRGRFVENQQGCILEQRTGNGQALALASRKQHSVLTHQRFVTLRHLLDKLGRIGIRCGPLTASRGAPARSP